MLINKVVRYCRKQIYIKTFPYRWRKRNKHNSTRAVYPFGLNTVSVGTGTYGDLRVFNDIPDRKLKIGNYCSIALDVTFILGLDHPLNNISTFPFMNFYGKGNPHEAISKGDIIIEDDVWIGYRSTILSGVHIGQGAVIAAGSVVTKDVPPYTVVAGVPAKNIKKRFPDEMIKELLEIKYESLDEDVIKTHLNELYSPLKDKKQLDWLKN